MTTVSKLSIALTPELAGEVREAVASGRYASASEVVRDALRVWRLHRAAEVEWLRRAWAEGIASGPATDDGSELMARLMERHRGLAADQPRK